MSAAGDTLRAARETLSDPTRWTQGAYARSASGRRLWFESPSAVCWCAYGALGKHSGLHPEEGRAADFLRRAADELFDLYPTEVNDDRGHAAVLSMYDLAIALADVEARS